MKKVLFISFVILTQWASAQLTIKSITPAHSTTSSARISDELPALSLPFWDDFSYAGDVPDSLWEFSSSIYVNEAIAIDPPTYKAATFDGLDAYGQLYSEDSEFAGLTDQLVSRRIELGSHMGTESIYLSFFWEAGGNGEHPEGTDSLRLQLLNADSVWVTEWKMRADEAPSYDTFTQVILNVSSEYLHDDFRFKFESFGSLQGPFDTWHIDYVYLDEKRTSNDLYYDDQAFTGSVSSIISPYREMPANHFFEDPSKYVTLQNFQMFNLLDDDLDGFEANFSLKVLDETGSELETITFSDGSIIFEGNQTINTETLDASDDSSGSTQIDDPAFISPISPTPDSVTLSITLTSDFDDDYAINDTIRSQHTLQNYYAYDDGVAEFAAGVSQNKGSIAVQYVLETQDTLSHVDIYFPSIYPISSGSSINVNIWKDLDGSDPTSSKTFTVSSTGRNEFTRIQLTEPILVWDTIYVGFTQNTSEYVAVGVDRSNPLGTDKVYYRTSGSWQPNSLVNGVLMIRPVFASSDYIVGVTPEKQTITFYPNPTSGLLNIPERHAGIQILGLNGKILMEENNKTMYDLSHLKTGIYLLRVIDQDQAPSTFKLIVE